MAAAGLSLTRLTLSDFRNYRELVWRPDGRIVVVHGPNGSGKTNLLEAISLLTPGRGLRSARIADLARRDAAAPAAWAVAGQFDTQGGRVDIGTGTPPDGPADRRVFRLDGMAPRNQAEIASLVSAVWLTPQMDRIFSEGIAGRRRFLDRLVVALQPGHAREWSAYETAMSQRNRLLAEGGADTAWLNGLEDAMARHSVAVAAGRLDLEHRLNEATRHAPLAGGFPRTRVTLLCPVAEALRTDPAVVVEEWLRGRLAGLRGIDRASGGATLGIHRADFAASDAATGLGASDASTGQQKVLLISLILRHAALLAGLRGVAPLLLLDEVAVHLDLGHRLALFEALRALPAQAFLTGTDADTFAPMRADAAGFEAVRAQLARDASFAPPNADLGPQTLS